MACDQCQLARINGIVCHELGCPNAWKDPVTNKPYAQECICGRRFVPKNRHQKYCNYYHRYGYH